MTEPPILEIRDLHVTFRTGAGPVKAVDGVTLELCRGETVAMVGESGAGKSVTALAVLGLLPERHTERSGRIVFDGRNIGDLDRTGLQRLRGNRIAMVFQDPMTSLNPVLTIGRQITETLVVHGACTRRQARIRAAELLTLVGIVEPERRLREYPHQFSAGMRQRVLIAIAVACGPDVIIADEPTSALDVTVQAQVLDVLDTVCAEHRTALLHVTHDLGVVAGRSDRVIVVYAGRVVESGSTRDVFARPAMPYTLGLLGSTTRIDSAPGSRLAPIPGSPVDLLDVPKGCAFHPRCEYARERCRAEEPILREVGPGRLAACHEAELVLGTRAGAVP